MYARIMLKLLTNLSNVFSGLNLGSSIKYTGFDLAPAKGKRTPKKLLYCGVCCEAFSGFNKGQVTCALPLCKAKRRKALYEARKDRAWKAKYDATQLAKHSKPSELQRGVPPTEGKESAADKARSLARIQCYAMYGKDFKE